MSTVAKSRSEVARDSRNHSRATSELIRIRFARARIRSRRGESETRGIRNGVNAPASLRLPLRLAIARSILPDRHAIEQFFRAPPGTGIRRRAGGRGRAGRSGEASVEHTREHEDSRGRSTTPRENKPSAGKIRIERASEGARLGDATTQRRRRRNATL